jgi:hypothetical protein
MVSHGYLWDSMGFLMAQLGRRDFHRVIHKKDFILWISCFVPALYTGLFRLYVIYNNYKGLGFKTP